MIRIAHVDVKRIFGKAEENEIPAQIELVQGGRNRRADGYTARGRPA